ncbi:Arylsulfatase [Thalassovita gelatinovora]|uniref:Arylsulfatase n=1 Tax=Thalassovita gelatinovora TaxID=53501 RepID=A0A0P1G5X5_THAGE|nr:sulfatase-like hydrolase/transferase [Thalassovita gelatinovora]QIZ82037.1 sulfatase-like hydrolase/transferase [Thalassovita gelatinovora]CUH67523.1 Arylsulfatase [Thalassovita gelatinovora]SEP72452.1 Arylsulfatase A [Thalassovita gelatinovora]
MNNTERGTPARPANQSQAHFILWTGAILGVFLAVVRGIALSDALTGGTIARSALLLMRGLGQDWLIVLVLTLVFTALVRTANGGVLGRVLTILFGVSATLVLLTGLANLVALRMLGAPLTMDWVAYSDLTHTDVALDYMRRVVSAKVVVVGVGSIVVLLGAAAVLARTHSGAVPKLMMGLMAFAVISGFAQRSSSSGVSVARLQNPIVAFATSVGRDSGIKGLDGPATDQAGLAMPFAPADPLPHPGKPAKPIRNAIIFAYESTPANQTKGWTGPHDVTPNLTAILDRALAFDRAYAHVPASNYFLVSAFAALIPELSPISMLSNWPDLDAIFVPEVMRANGLRTAFFNSSDNRFQDTEGLVTAAGFEQVGDYRDWDCETGVYEYASVTDKYLNTSSDLCTVSEIVKWIEQRPDDPFFVSFRTGMTHYPYFSGENPQEYVADKTYNDYLNALRVGDEAFGKLMAYLDQSGLADETLVVVLGDHGEAFGQHGTYVHAAGINEENVHIPMALINPQLFNGTRSDLIVGVADIGPTITDLLEFPTPSSWQGRSVFDADRKNGILFFSPWNGFLVGFREDDEKFIYNGNTGEMALYDLATDPGELNNLAATKPEQAAAARDKLGTAVAVHNQYIDWLLTRSGAAKLEQTDANEIEIVATGMRFKSAPEGWVMMDGEHVGGFKLTSAPSNADRAVTQAEIDAALTTFHMPVTTGPCPRNIELFFLNDEWAGEGQTGDTDLFIRSVKFAGTTYYFNRFTALNERTGGASGEYYRFWRNGGIRIDLDLDQTCLSNDLAQQ